jgi:hypothetical protein
MHLQVNKQRKRNNRITKFIDLGLQRTGVPNRLKVKLPFVQNLNFTGTGFNQQVYRVNGPYDPDASGAGAQPVGYDEWSYFYQRQWTKNTEIQVELINNSALPVTVNLCTKISSASLTDIEEAVGQPTSKYLKLGSSTSQNRGILRMTSNAHDFEGWSSQVDSLQSVVTSTPSTASYFNLSCENFGGTAVNVYATVRIIYNIDFFDLRALPVSTLNRAIVDENGLHYLDVDVEEKKMKIEKEKEKQKETISKSEKEPNLPNSEIEPDLSGDQPQCLQCFH